MKYLKNWAGAVLFIIIYKFLIESFPSFKFFIFERSWMQSSLLDFIFIVIVSISGELIFKSIKNDSRIKIKYDSFFILIGVVISIAILLLILPGVLLDKSMNINVILFHFYPLIGSIGYVIFRRINNSVFINCFSFILIMNVVFSLIYASYFY